MIDLQASDESILKLLKKAPQGSRGNGSVSFNKRDGLWYRVFTHPNYNDGKPKEQVLVPKQLRNTVMELAHDSILAGHLGNKKTKDRILTAFYWPGISGDVTRYCRSCDICQKTIPKGRVPKVPLQHMPLIDQPFKRVAVDLIGEIKPASEEGHRWILTLVDYGTRYPEAIALKKIDTESVAEALVEIFSRVGVPEEILTDLGTQFVSQCMEEVHRLLCLRHLTTTPYHPMCNGLVENFNGCLKNMLKKLSTEQPKQWHRYLNPLLFAYREVKQESTGFAPFELLYGRSVRGPMIILKELWTNENKGNDVKNSYQYVFELRQKLEKTLQLAQENIQKSQKASKHYYDKKAKDRKFQKGDKVLILLPTDHNKLLMQWKGPFEIKEMIGLNDYKVQVGSNMKTYHANLLKKYVERIDSSITAAIGVEEENNEKEFECEEILQLNDVLTKESVHDVKYGDNLDEDQLKTLKDITFQFPYCFRETPDELDSTYIEHEVNLSSTEPIKSKPYPLPYSARENLKHDIDEMIKLGVIRESKSPYAAPVVIVKKPDGSDRICIDFRKINKITLFDPEPMPNPEDLFRQLSSSKFFTKIDLSKGYWQIKVKEEDIPKTAFITPDGTYECLRMPFGMVNSGATLKRGMKKLLSDLPNVVYYWDDLLIHTETWNDHMTLKAILQKLTNANLTIRPSKCIFGTNTIDFIGHTLREGEKSLLRTNVEKVLNAPRPKTKKQVQSFMGLAGYYREFMPNFSAITAPLTDLVKKGNPNNVKWEDAQERAYQTIKKMLSEDPVLKLPDPNKQFTLRTDGSDEGIGSVLLQEHDEKLYPVSYASKKLSKTEKNYSTIEKECLAIIWGIRKYERYLLGTKFKLQTDHQPLTYMQTAKFTNARIMRWTMYLQNFEMQVESIKGEDNVGADFLSRVVD